MRVGVVCEGENDYKMFRELAFMFKTDAANFKCLQPNGDATSSHGGFGRVIGWCKKHCGLRLRSYFDQPLFAGELPIDFLLIHIDGDAVGDCLRHAGLEIAVPESVEDIVRSSQRALLTLLAPTPEHSDRIIVAVPVQHTDSWILAALSDQDGLSWENINAKDLVKTLFLKRLDGRRSTFEVIAAQAVVKIDRLRERCASFSLFEGDVAALVS